jgi:hypothetical protein
MATIRLLANAIAERNRRRLRGWLELNVLFGLIQVRL